MRVCVHAEPEHVFAGVMRHATLMRRDKSFNCFPALGRVACCVLIAVLTKYVLMESP